VSRDQRSTYTCNKTQRLNCSLYQNLYHLYIRAQCLLFGSRKNICLISATSTTHLELTAKQTAERKHGKVIPSQPTTPKTAVVQHRTMLLTCFVTSTSLASSRVMVPVCAGESTNSFAISLVCCANSSGHPNENKKGTRQHLPPYSTAS